MGELMSRKFPHLPERLVRAALSEWYAPRAVPTGPMPERFQRVMAAVDADRLATLVGPDTQEDVAGRHPNEQPGARMSPAQQQLAAAVLADLKMWAESEAELRGGFEADGIGAVLDEIDRRTRWPHVGPNVSAVLREPADRARVVRRDVVVEKVEKPVNRMPNRVEQLDSAFLQSRPPGLEEDVPRRAARHDPAVDTPTGWADRG